MCRCSNCGVNSGHRRLSPGECIGFKIGNGGSKVSYSRAFDLLRLQLLASRLTVTTPWLRLRRNRTSAQFIHLFSPEGFPFRPVHCHWQPQMNPYASFIPSVFSFTHTRTCRSLAIFIQASQLAQVCETLNTPICQRGVSGRHLSAYVNFPRGL